MSERLNNFTIANLHPNAINFIVNGIIIGKANMVTFEKKGQTALCGVVKFLLRDSYEHFINVTVWGSAEFIEDYNHKFTIGHVVSVMNSRLSPVRHGDIIFDPITSSPLQLTINEGIGAVKAYEGNVTEIVKLLNVPLKSPDLALNLADIASTRPTSDLGDSVDLLVVVAKLKPTRQTNHSKCVRDVIVVDQTVAGMYLTIWNEAWIDKSDSWNEMSTVLHLINVRFKYSDFHKSVVLITQPRTVIIADPQGPQRCESLKNFANSSTLILTDFDTSEPDLSTIQTVMSIQQIADLLDMSTEPVFYSLTYVMITQMDIDGWTPFYSRRCIHCNCQIKIKDKSCDKENCSIFFAESPLDQHFINYFNIPVHLTDHTGTLDQCRLVGDTAERILGYTLVAYLALSDTERSSIKWKFLMERCAVKLRVKRKTALRWNTQITIVDCQVADTNEVFENIKRY